MQSQNYIEEVRTKNIRRTLEFTIPLLKHLINIENKNKIKILSVGCGNGEDVETLVDYGFNGTFGIDIDKDWEREWRNKKHKEKLFLMDARNTLFPDNFFDIILCYDIIEHMGEGKSYSERKKEREKFANEILRILKKEGYIILTTPNKLFPLDTGHGVNKYGVRIHFPWREDFLLSYSEIKTLFKNCKIKTIPFGKYWIFKKVKKYFWIKSILPLIKIYLRILDTSVFSPLRKSFLSFALFLLIKK